MKTIIFLSLSLLFISGCSQKVLVKTLQPAQVSRTSDVKKVTVLGFKNDRVGLSNKIEAKMFQYKIDGKSYFTVLSRRDLGKVLAEQKIQNSGLIDPSTAIDVGNIIGAQAIISGDVSNPSYKDTDFYEKRTRCDKEKCWEVKVMCTRRVFSLSAQMRLVDAKKGDIIFADAITKTTSAKHCTDDAQLIPSTQMASQMLAEHIAESFVYKLLPHYVYFSVELLEKPDLDYSDAQEKLLENALGYIKQNRYDKAETLLVSLIESTGEKSYVPLYDLGIIKEAQGKLEEAKELYYKADNLTQEPIEQISKAINRIEKSIEQSRQALQQISSR